MSRNAVRRARGVDARVRRTRESLGDALMQLMRERPFREIRVKDVLDRAGVGRSTFYAHYRNKDDLFFTDVEEFFHDVATRLRREGDTSGRVAPVRELFDHVAEWHDFYDALVASGKLHDVLDIGRGCMARGIEERLGELSPGTVLASPRRAALAAALAAAMLSLMRWWIDHGMRGSATEMDELFHRLVRAGAGVRPARDAPQD